MKDSQPGVLPPVSGTKYIKADNERFSTGFDALTGTH